MLMLAAGLVPTLALAGAAPAAAEFISAPDVVVYCDPTLGHALGDVGENFRARTGVAVRVHTAPGTLLVELLAHGTRNDVLVTLVPLMDAAAARHLIKPETLGAAWRDPVVLAGRDLPPGAAPVDAQALRVLLGGGRLAVIDPVAADRMDGPEAVRRLGWSEVAADRVDGMATGQDVAFAVASGAARLGLLHRSDLAGHRGLRAVGTVSEQAAPAALYAAAISKNIQSSQTVAFMAYLGSSEALAHLGDDGLEMVR